MAITDVQGLDQLYNAISEALEIEKCSICLEKLENTVLLWPCTHWFCNNCISTLHKSAKGEKVTCPLCKSATTRRKILHFHNKQKEYEDHLQTLIGALSLDLKFDVTSYNNLRKHENSTINEIVDTNKTPRAVSPLEKARTKTSIRVVEVKNKPDLKQTERRSTRRSGKVPPKTKNPDVVKNNKMKNKKLPQTILTLLPETPDDSPKQKKVKEWLDSNRFSQADQDICVETVVADVHNAEANESLCYSETALQSVSQIDHGGIQIPSRLLTTKSPLDTPSDVDAIKVLNSPSEKVSKNKLNRHKKVIPVSSVDKFDELFPENKKIQTVTTTYGSKNPYTSTSRRGQRFAVQVDLFKSIDENKCDIEKCSPEEILGTSEETLEDFSSGSGEEWTIDQKKRKSNLMTKGIKTPRQAAQRKTQKSIEKYVKAKKIKCSPKDSCKKDLKSLRVQKNNPPSPVKLDPVEEFIKPKEDIVKDIMDDWNDTKDSSNLNSIRNQTLAKESKDLIVSEDGKVSETTSKTIDLKRTNVLAKTENKVGHTPCKEMNTRSPGWSRLKSTKKEFHLSEKKKLNLKTLNKSNSSLTNIGISPLINQSKSSISSSNQINIDQNIVQTIENVEGKTESSIVNDMQNNNSKELKVHCGVEKQKTPELNRNLNTSHSSSTSKSPFRGFPSPEEKETFKETVSNLDHTKETPQKSNNLATSSLPHRGNTFNIITRLENQPTDQSSKIDKMEVDIAHDDRQIPTKCKTLTAQNIPETNLKSFEDIISVEGGNAKNVLEQEPEGHPSFTKKRDRDSGIHNESGISSPIRKRICRDAEVQTSPGRLQSALHDMLKDMCGMELEDIIHQQSNKTEIRKPLIPVDATSAHHSFTRLSQDSDKENINLSSKNQNAFKKCDDSDIVPGTEDNIAFGLNHNMFKNNVLDIYNADPDAPTQPYKTPVVPKRPLQTSTKEYTVVSNPASSELKRVDSFFDKSDVIFPGETPKRMTPWNYSGVGQLLENTGTVNKSVEPAPLSQCLKEKSNRSRRHLDFVEENSNDMFEFERQTSSNSKEDDINSEPDIGRHIDKAGTVEEKNPELDDIFMENNYLLDDAKASPNKNQKVSTCCDKEIAKHQETSFINENLTDTSGIVGPSEVQCAQNLRSLFASDKQGCGGSHKNIFAEQPVICTEKIQNKSCDIINDNTYLDHSANEDVNDYPKSCHGSPLKLKASSSEKKDFAEGDKEVRSPSSDISFVEGTPDVSQNEENHKALNSETNAKESDGQPEKTVDTLEFHSEKDIEKPPVFGTGENFRQEKEKILQGAESSCNQFAENTETEDDLCFASSLLNPQQNQVLACVLGGMGLTYSKTVGPHISHLIVGTKNGCFQNTYKVLLAMALHKPIIRYDWVEEVIRTGGTVPLDPFVALDPSGECGVLRAKVDKKRELLKNFAIHIYNVNDRIVMKEQIEELVRLCGGLVVKELHDFLNIPRDKFRIIVLSEPPDSLTQGDWRQRYSAAEVMIDWIYNTIGRYRVMPLEPFMVTDANESVSFA